MQKVKYSGSVKEEFMEKMLECSCESFSNVTDEYFWRSFSGEQEDLLNETPRVSFYNHRFCINLDRRLCKQSSLSSQEMTLSYRLARSTDTNQTSSPKNATELAKEIATLELEIVHLETYILSLYRTVFEYYMNDSSIVSSEYSRHSSGGMLTKKHTDPSVNHSNIEKKSDPSHGVTSCSLSTNERESVVKLWDKDSCSTLHVKCDLDNSGGRVPKHDSQKDMLEVVSDHQCDTDQFNNTPLNPACKLSEDILRCIAAIYCKLANIPTPQIGKVVLPVSSSSFSSTISQKSSSENWSPQSQHEAAASPSLFGQWKDEHEIHSEVIEIPRISVDGERFGYASKMLSTFRILIKQLKSIDPLKMAYEEQIAFWLNIHNALVMHAFLAYGLHQGRMKSTSSILKAAYNVGGNTINAHVIQSSILLCQHHLPASWLEVLLSPALKFRKWKRKHVYALEHPQTLAHFAICQGACSDPAVRVYTSKHIMQELAFARKEFIQANVRVQKKNKIILPKILCYYMKDSSLETSNLLKMVIECMPENEQRAVQECMKGSSDSYIVWSRYNSSFRYIIHRDLAKQ